eukprot:gnl/TRDRNA2_/TRDRNA2_190780_c1_seq1.p2 gnl/TRDRNA2_/TRDRNA2_190780_c1~~gnl/TRDRNA2_/TRDRNA2_190780_c1_seq1.p2  ORF type:complete len:128 (-),score=9.82 gnl/TRDRNA2_/TRDRNA2_190780_c1_seq1:52-435(-)
MPSPQHRQVLELTLVRWTACLRCKAERGGRKDPTHGATRGCTVYEIQAFRCTKFKAGTSRRNMEKRSSLTQITDATYIISTLNHIWPCDLSGRGINKLMPGCLPSQAMFRNLAIQCYCKKENKKIQQ